MIIQLMANSLNSIEALALLTGHIHTEISYCEKRLKFELDDKIITHYHNHIKHLYKSLFEARKLIENNEKITLSCIVELKL